MLKSIILYSPLVVITFKVEPNFHRFQFSAFSSLSFLLKFVLLKLHNVKLQDGLDYEENRFKFRPFLAKLFSIRDEHYPQIILFRGFYEKSFIAVPPDWSHGLRKSHYFSSKFLVVNLLQPNSLILVFDDCPPNNCESI